MNSARKLVEQDKVDILVGPLSGGEGIAVKDYFEDAAAGDLHQRLIGRASDDIDQPVAQLLPLQHRRRQWMVGLGKEAMKRGYKKA